MIFFLVGFPSVGKTTLGKKISEITYSTFIDSDKYIELGISKTCSEYIKEYGIEKWHELEQEFLKSVEDLGNTGDEIIIISLGGGFVTSPQIMDKLKTLGTVIWINGLINLEKLQQDITRPFTYKKSLNDIEDLLNKRSEILKFSNYEFINKKDCYDCVRFIRFLMYNLKK